MDNSSNKGTTDLKSPSSSAAAAAPPAAPGQQPKTTTTEGPEIDTLSDATAAEAYTPPPKPVEKRLKRRRPRSKESLKRREERRRIKDLENRRRMKTFTRESDIVAESAPTESVPNENNEKAKDEGSEDFLNKLLEGQSAPSPLLDKEWLKLQAEERQERHKKELENRRRLKTRARGSDILAESAPADSVPNENNEKAKDEGSEDFLNKLLKGQSAPSPLLDEEGNPILEEDPYETLPLVRIIRAVTNLVAYLMDNPLVAFGIAFLILLTRK